MQQRWLGLAGPVAKALQPAGCLISQRGKLTVSMFAFVGLTDNQAQDETHAWATCSAPPPVSKSLSAAARVYVRIRRPYR